MERCPLFTNLFKRNRRKGSQEEVAQDLETKSPNEKNTFYQEVVLYPPRKSRVQERIEALEYQQRYFNDAAHALLKQAESHGLDTQDYELPEWCCYLLDRLDRIIACHLGSRDEITIFQLESTLQQIRLDIKYEIYELSHPYERSAAN